MWDTTYHLTSFRALNVWQVVPVALRVITAHLATTDSTCLHLHVRHASPDAPVVAQGLHVPNAVEVTILLQALAGSAMFKIAKDVHPPPPALNVSQVIL